ncbi:hypothetical protein [Haloplanus halophilus]|uniref:hypothetical protein n=1 Tax=Haloplanus halophilus TaxID=2949993 RepID=UPI00203CC19F|nr:hypothetical protein [Haloplanus sp. GDY1]
MTDAREPTVDERIDLYVTIRSLFRDRPFEATALGRRLVERGEHEYVSATGEPAASLSWLVEAGVVTADADGYRVAADPDEAAEKLATAGGVDVDAVRRRLLSALAADEGAPRTLSREGGTYGVVRIDPSDSVGAAVERALAAVDADHRGAVLTTPGTNADLAQRVADRLAADHSWSKAGSTVVEGETPDAELVFRLYLDA